MLVKIDCTYLEEINNDRVILLPMVYPCQFSRFSIAQFTVVNIHDVLPLFHLVQIFMQTIHEDSEEFLRILLIVSPHLRYKPVNHSLQININSVKKNSVDSQSILH